MITLPNNCQCSELSVYPKNWLTGGAPLLKKDWYIQYYFRDPLFKSKYPYGKLQVIKGMNKFKTLEERRAYTKTAIEHELRLLKEKAYNPITGVTMQAIETDYEIDPHTNFMDALNKAFHKIKIEGDTKTDMKSVLKYFSKSLMILRYDILPISQVKRKHIRHALDNCANLKKDQNDKKEKKIWNANQFNHYRKYLSILFSQLVELEAIDVNPVRDISKERTISSLRILLTNAERKKIDDHFAKTDPAYQRFLHIFFHSGARPKELLCIKKEDVNIEKQTYKITIIKGKYKREELRPIKNIALQYWECVYHDALPEQFLFGKNLKPGDKPTTRDYISKKWLREVKGKEKLNIQADLYSLKHSNLDETAAELDINAAARMAGHTSTVITMKHYAIGEKERQHERLKSVNNKFA